MKEKIKKASKFIITVKMLVMGETFEDRETELRNVVQVVLDITNKF